MPQPQPRPRPQPQPQPGKSVPQCRWHPGQPLQQPAGSSSSPLAALAQSSLSLYPHPPTRPLTSPAPKLTGDFTFPNRGTVWGRHSNFPPGSILSSAGLSLLANAGSPLPCPPPPTLDLPHPPACPPPSGHSPSPSSARASAPEVPGTGKPLLSLCAPSLGDTVHPWHWQHQAPRPSHNLLPSATAVRPSLDS